MKEQETLNEDYFDENQYEIDNRIRNLYWTVSGNYGENIKLDTVSFSRSPWVSLYDAVKQGAFSRYFDRNAFGLYLVKKLYYGADEQALTNVAQLAVDSAVYRKISAERKGVQEIRKKAFSDLLEYDFTRLASYYLGQIKICMMQQAVRGSVSHEQARMRQVLDLLAELEDTYDTMEIIRVTDKLYNWLMDPYFEKNHGDLAKVLAVTMEELKEFSWKDYLEEEAKEEELTQVLNQVNQAVTQTGEASTEQEEKRESRMKRVLVDAEAAAKMYSYIELNYGRSYLNEGEQKRINRSLCRGAHADCSLYFTDGILSNMVKRNYQSEYARRSKSENLRVYGHHSRVAKRNIEILTDTLRRALVARSERETVRSEYGNILPKQLWKLGRSRDKKLFERVLKKDSSEFVVHVLIDASGSQRSRQSLVALQGYIISEALSNVQIPHRVMGFCTFWDYTVMQRYRDYDDPKEANKRIFEFHASSNNRDGLAIRAAAASLRDRPEENKVLIVLSDGRPNDIIVNRPNSKNPMPYAGDYAVRDTSFEVRKVRAEGISVLGVFAGEEQDLQAERRIFGKDFAYIRNIMNFSSVVGLYLKRQLDDTAQ
ncbi:cobaltochelatase CobT-related protein [Laedolimicola ammoniilytica]|uniref:Nitric oxide reductase activation protein n=1 Tax=Laedolimicola ammoniilytica TaxID=2981771 RepID=A0ABT2RYN2_9FIRM|nr:nitric oxide reductase activation protein [Laedolimicola ammoniilytica]MCU6697393.1 nitric oxide reductase activation protein [Laedolimicola ammoniilytica]SCI24111.1 Nitric oxide reductase activation protein [uncultured Clostridium sp.]